MNDDLNKLIKTILSSPNAELKSEEHFVEVTATVVRLLCASVYDALSDDKTLIPAHFYGRIANTCRESPMMYLTMDHKYKGDIAMRHAMSFFLGVPGAVTASYIQAIKDCDPPYAMGNFEAMRSRFLKNLHTDLGEGVSIACESARRLYKQMHKVG